MKSAHELRIVFFGTPDFALASLEALIAARYNVVAVVTAPDKPAGRGLKVQETAVKVGAVKRGIPVLQPSKLKAPDFLEKLTSFQADVQVVVAFRMLPEVVWNMPPLGTINVHASLLPQYRGAAPINWAIINGESETGVTTFRLQHEIDTGNILLQDSAAILPDDDAGTLHDRLMAKGADLLVKTIEGLSSASIIPQAQSELGHLHHAPKIFKADLEINWQQTAQQVLNFIRGMAPYPTAYTPLRGKQLKVFKAHIEAAPEVAAPATMKTDEKSYLRFAAVDAWIAIDELQLEGKKRMPVAEFLRGFRA